MMKKDVVATHREEGRSLVQDDGVSNLNADFRIHSGYIHRSLDLMCIWQLLQPCVDILFRDLDHR